MKISIEPVYDPFGGMYPYVTGIKKYSRHDVSEVTPRIARVLLNRSTWLKRRYKDALKQKGLKNCSVAHSMSDPWFVDVCASSHKNSVKWVHTYHIMFFEADYARGLADWQIETNHAQLEVASKADVRIATSRWMHEYLKTKHSIDTDIVMGGIDVDLCCQAKAERFALSTGIVDPVLFVGSIRDVKDPALFVDLACRTRDRTFVMVGPDLNKENLEQKYDVEVPPNVIFTGKMRREEVLDVMAACKVYVLTSKHEGFPQSVLEAMAIGKKVVISSYVGSDEMVPSEDFGFIFEKGNADDLKDKFEQALLAPEDIGKNAAERVAKEFDWKVLVKKIDQLYER